MRKKDRERRIERFKELLRVTEKIPPKQFEMGHWYESNCKTTGCLMGHAAHDPFFTKRGISLEADTESLVSRGRNIYDYDGLNANVQYNLLFYKRNEAHPYKSEGAARAFFDIYGDDVEHLFMWASTSNHANDKRRAIKKIKTFIKYLQTHPNYGAMPNWEYETQWE